ncbi:MAG TPA: hypothetical protein PLM48_05660 [Clostridia bacterium]|nr:hypothetical protein [Clostridia bacterium]
MESTETISTPMEAETAENPFCEAVSELIAMQNEGALPEGFALDEACKDGEFAQLITEFGAKAAVRVYSAEKRASDAVKREADMRDTVTKELTDKQRSRLELPKSRRTNFALSSEPDYINMGSEQFRRLESQLKRSSRS